MYDSLKFSEVNCPGNWNTNQQTSPSSFSYSWTSYINSWKISYSYHSNFKIRRKEAKKKPNIFWCYLNQTNFIYWIESNPRGELRETSKLHFESKSSSTMEWRIWKVELFLQNWITSINLTRPPHHALAAIYSVWRI